MSYLIRWRRTWISIYSSTWFIFVSWSVKEDESNSKMYPLHHQIWGGCELCVWHDSQSRCTIIPHLYLHITSCAGAELWLWTLIVTCRIAQSERDSEDTEVDLQTTQENALSDPRFERSTQAFKVNLSAHPLPSTHCSALSSQPFSVKLLFVSRQSSSLSACQTGEV